MYRRTRTEESPRRGRLEVLLFLIATSLLVKNVVSRLPDWPNLETLPGSPFRLPHLRVATEYEIGTKATEDGLELRASVSTAGQFIDTHVDKSDQEEFVKWLSEQAMQTITKESHEKYPLADLIRYLYEWRHVKNLESPHMMPSIKTRTIMGNRPNANEVILVDFICEVFKSDQSMMQFAGWLETKFHIDVLSENKTALWKFYRLDDLLRSYVEWVKGNDMEDIHEAFHFHLDNQQAQNLQIGQILQNLLQYIHKEKVFEYWGPLSPPLAKSGPDEDILPLSKQRSLESKSMVKESDKNLSEEKPGSSILHDMVSGSSSSKKVAVWHYALIPEQCPYGNSERHFHDILQKASPDVKPQLNEYLMNKAKEEFGTVPQNICTDTLNDWLEEFEEKNRDKSSLIQRVVGKVANFFAPQA